MMSAGSFHGSRTISRVMSLGDHLSRPTVAGRFEQPTRKHSGQLYRFLFGLASSGVYRALPVTSQAVSSYLAVPPLPENSGGLFLLHLSESRLYRTLSGTLPCEARTFLTCCLSALAAAITCPTRLHCSILIFFCKVLSRSLAF